MPADEVSSLPNHIKTCDEARLTKPLAKVFGLYTKPRRLAFARLKPAQLFSALLAASRPALVWGSMQMRYIATAAKCSATQRTP